VDASQKSDLVGQRLLQYQVTERLSVGGLGAVYRAIDLKLKRSVALKVLPASLAPSKEDKRRLIREIRTCRSLEHANLADIYGIEEIEDGKLLLVTAYYEGPSLAQRLNHESISVPESAAIALQLLHGLQEAHARGIVHGDIKPRNLIFNALGVLKILDFGLAKYHSNPRSAPAGSVPIAAAYMSPENAAGAPADPRSDLWSAGVILYEMLSHESLFPGTDPEPIVAALLSSDPLPLKGMPEGLDLIVKKALEKDPVLRYQSAAEMILDIEAAEAQRIAALEEAEAAPKTSRPAPRPARPTRKPSGRRWFLLGIAAIFAIGVFAFWLHLRRSSRMPQVALALGRVRLVEGKYSDAVSEFQQVLALDPKNDGAFRGLAQAYAAMGLPDKAVESWQTDISLHPDSVDPYDQLAKFELNRGDYPAAASDFRRALNVAPANPSLLSNLGAALAHSGSLDDSRRALMESIHLAPSFSAWMNLGDLDLRQKQFADAAADYEKAMQFNNSDYHVWANLAIVYAHMPAQEDKARRASSQAAHFCREMLKSAPDDPVLLSDLAAILSSQPNGHQESVTLLQRSLALAPENPRVQFDAAQAYANLGEEGNAMAWVTKLVSAGFPPGDFDLNPVLGDLVRTSHGPVLVQNRPTLSVPTVQ